jgi:hypothetical protein
MVRLRLSVRNKNQIQLEQKFVQGYLRRSNEVTLSKLSMWPGNNHLLPLSKTRDPLRLEAGGH